LQVNFTDIGSVYQDERNRAALLLYKDGDRDQYLMVSRFQRPKGRSGYGIHMAAGYRHAGFVKDFAEAGFC
jgi:hypothetical protein